MKFPTEKKSTLCIYTEETQTGDKMEQEVTALRSELDATRHALRTQTARCRQLVAAFTARLRRKEQEERQGRELRDQQLSTVLRALLVLEGRLRKEQRAIQRQLHERDAVIRSQTLEIARLRRAARSSTRNSEQHDSSRKPHNPQQTQEDHEHPVIENVDSAKDTTIFPNNVEEKPLRVPSNPQHDPKSELGQSEDTSCQRDSNPDHGVQHIIRKLERERNSKKSPEFGVKFDEESIKHTSRRPYSADFDRMAENVSQEVKMNGYITQSLENLDICNTTNQRRYVDKMNEGFPQKTSTHGSETCDNSVQHVNGPFESLSQDNIDSETSESTVVAIREIEDHQNQQNVGECNLKCGGKRFIKHQGLKPSECTLNRLKCNSQKDTSNEEEFVTKFECEGTYGLEPTLDSDSGVFQGSSAEGSDSSLKSDCQDNSYQDQEDDMPNRDLYKDYQHNPVLECVNQILLRDQDDIMDTTVYRHNDDSDKIEDLKKGRFNNLWPSIQEEHESQTEEEDNNDSTVIEPTLKTAQETEVHPTPQEIETENGLDNKCEQKKLSLKEKIPSPPIKAQHLQEKACLLMSSQRLTLVRNLELEEVDNKEENESRHKVSYQKAKAPALLPQGRSSVPPALPPKPPQLGSMCRLRHKRNMFHTQLNQSPHPIHSNGTISHDPRHIHMNSSETNRESGESNLDSLTKPKLPHPSELHMHYSHPIYQEKPRQRQILSNGSLKRALNHDSMSQESRQYNHDHQEKNTSKSFEERLDELNMSAYRHPVKVVGPVAARVQRQLEARPALHETSRHQYLKDGLVEDQSGKPHGANCGAIKVGSSVSSLITGSTGGSIVTELTQGAAAPRHEDARAESHHRDEDSDGDEDGNATLRSNFEEFRLEDVDMDSVEEVGRPAGDGAETAQASQNGGGGSYEHFLEATGLSQKSIMTPSRMFSNHRSVIKPKDVKHRSRVLKAAAVNERCGATGGGPIVKYWIEPFL